MKKTYIAVAFAAAALAAVLFFALRKPAEAPYASVDEEDASGETAAEASESQGRRIRRSGDAEAPEETESDASTEDEGSDEDNDGNDSAENEEDPEEKAVDEFDAATDSWMEPKTVSMDDVYKFGESFRKIPKSRKEECLQRALNLIPDDNVMLLAGILMDKSLEPEYLEAVFNDVLNRAEDVKKPILDLIYKDKTHHCWADVAWIKDVTGESTQGDGGRTPEDAPAADEEQTAEDGQ